MSGMRRSLPALAADARLRREAGALALYRLAEFGPWVAMLVFAYSQGGTTATGLVSLSLLIPTALFAPFAGPLIDRYGASRVLLGAYVAQGLAMGCTAVSLLVGAPAVVSYALGAVTAMALAVTHPAHAVVSPGIARTTEQLVALNAVTGGSSASGSWRRRRSQGSSSGSRRQVRSTPPAPRASRSPRCSSYRSGSSCLRWPGRMPP